MPAIGQRIAKYAPKDHQRSGPSYGTATVGDTQRRFNNKEYDWHSGLHYYGYRYYDPFSLTWNRADPLYRFAPDIAFDEPRRMNLYAFSLNNPVHYVDPDGRQSKKIVETAVKACVDNPTGCAAVGGGAAAAPVAVVTTLGVGSLFFLPQGTTGLGYGFAQRSGPRVF